MYDAEKGRPAGNAFDEARQIGFGQIPLAKRDSGRIRTAICRNDVSRGSPNGVRADPPRETGFQMEALTKRNSSRTAHVKHPNGPAVQVQSAFLRKISPLWAILTYAYPAIVQKLHIGFLKFVRQLGIYVF